MRPSVIATTLLVATHVVAAGGQQQLFRVAAGGQQQVSREAAGGQQQVFRTGVETVAVYATVLDQLGEMVLDLDRDDFIVFDNGTPQELTIFETGVDTGVTNAAEAPITTITARA